MALPIGPRSSTTICTACPSEERTLALDRLFVDASYFIARFNQGDEHHRRALAFDEAFSEARQLWTTDPVLLEVAASFAESRSRAFAIRIWDECHGNDPRFRVAAASPIQLDEAMRLYRARPDKSWSLADCFSFVTMEREKLSEALTSDHHFQQAGFRALLLDDLG